MGTYDDEKHPRDDKGRFSPSGAAGPTHALSEFAKSPMKHGATWGESAKTKSFKSGRRVDTHVAVKELKGYSKGEGTAGKVEGRARDLEIPLIRKNEPTLISHETEFQAAFDSAWSGKEEVAMKYPLQKISRAVSHQVDVLELDVKKAEVAASRARSRCLVGPGHNIRANEKGELVTMDGKPAEGQHKKLIDKANKADEEVDNKIREYAKATSISSAISHAWSPMNEFSKYLGKGDKVTFTRSPDDGSIQWHVRRPDESELSIEIEPALTKEILDKHVAGLKNFGGRKRFDPNYPEEAYDSRIRISTTYPSTKDDRANRQDTEGFVGVGKKWESSAAHIKEFFEAAHAHTPEKDEEADRFAAAHPKGVGIESGGSKPGEIWKPGKKTIGDY